MQATTITTTNFQTCLEWHSYAFDPDEDFPVPMETRESWHYGWLSKEYIEQLRKEMHGCGYKLVNVDYCDFRYEDEF